MRVFGFILSLLRDVRAHIPNQPGFGSRATDASSSTRAVAAFLIIVAFLATLVGLAVRLVIGFS
jgi:hypothetical protein